MSGRHVSVIGSQDLTKTAGLPVLSRPRRKEIREITISTYQSAISDLDLINNSNMIIFDEVHLVSDTATTLRKVLTAADTKKPLLDLTATIDEQDPRYNTILSLLPPVKKYIP